MVRLVTNEEYEAALKNEDHIKLITFITGSYSQLNADAKKRCGLIALWRAMKTYDASFKAKFTTSLYRYVHWECRRELKNQEVKQEGYRREQPRDEAEERENREFLKHYMSLLPAHDREIIKLHYLDGVSVRSLSEKMNCSRATVRKKIKASIEMLRELTSGTI